MSEKIGVLVRTGSGPGVLHQLTGVIAKHQGDISSVEISGHRDGQNSVYFEIELPEDPLPVLEELRALSIVRDVTRVASLEKIEQAVREVRAQGLMVVSLNMAGSVPEASDRVVTDPVQAGVMTVMAIADTAKFTIGRLQRRIY